MTINLSKVTYKDIRRFKKEIKKLSLIKNIFLGIAIGCLCLSTICIAPIVYFSEKNNGIILLFIILTAIFAILGVLLFILRELVISRKIRFKKRLLERAVQYKNENKRTKKQAIN